MKDRIAIILAILSVVFLFATLSSCNSAMRQKRLRDKEMAARLQMEEKMNKFSQERSVLEERIKVKEKEAQEARLALEETNKALEQAQMVSQGLKDELQKATKK